MEEHDNNGWAEYKRRVLYQLEELTRKSDAIEKKLDDLKTDVVVLKTKAVMYSAVTCFILTAIIQFILIVVKH